MSDRTHELEDGVDGLLAVGVSDRGLAEGAFPGVRRAGGVGDLKIDVNAAALVGEYEDDVLPDQMLRRLNDEGAPLLVERLTAPTARLGPTGRQASGNGLPR